MLCPDPRFRLHWYWPHWSYLNLEKKRNFQNTCRLLNQKNVSRQFHPTRAELISQSVYTERPILNESKTTPIPSSLRTAAPFSAEDKWSHLNYILSTTDNHDTLPSNRPLHTYLFYHNKLNHLRNKGFAYTESSIPNLINSNFIRADLPDPITEPHLHRLVSTYQIHRCCSNLCGGPGTDTHPCKKGFPQPLSNTTHLSTNSLRYTYRRLKEEDHWVVPYNPKTLFIWQGHLFSICHNQRLC